MLEARIRLVLTEVPGLSPSVFAVTTACFSMTRLDGIRMFRLPFVEPRLRRIFFLFFVPTGEDAVQIIGQLHVIAKDGGGIGVVLYVFAELLAILEHVMNQTAEKCDVAARAHWQPDV